MIISFPIIIQENMDFNIKGNVIFHNRVYSNEQLIKMENYVLEVINGYEENQIVALVLTRTPLMLATVFALLKRGIPFLPLDISFPEERLNYMLEKANVKTILSDCVTSVCGISTVMINSDEQDILKRATVFQDINQNAISDEQVAYILFTSGSTGLPKAVEVVRRGLKNFIEGIIETVIFESDCRIACLTSMTFDIFFLESVLALNEGMTVVLADDKERNNPRLIQKLLVSNCVNTMQCTPSSMRMMEMIDPDLRFLEKIRTLMLGGEPLPQTLLLTLQKVVSGHIYNMYGPTETTIWSTVSDLTNADEVNIGRAIKNTEVYIVDEKLSEVTDGEEGEILISGAGLAKRYLNDDEKTRRSFIMICNNNKAIRAYRTGDFGFKNEYGVLFCTGRRDNQVKVLGHRIELGDVEHHIARIQNIVNNVVTVDQNDGNRLICFYLSEQTLSDSYLRKEALKLLPDYMVPESWIRVPSLLYTLSGKTDRKAMLLEYKKGIEQGEDSYLINDSGQRNDNCENLILKQIIDCFDMKNDIITADTVLESLGLDSLKYVSCLVNIEDLFDIEFEDEMLLSNYFETVGDIEEFVKSAVDNL